jgi:hypothetical protein
VAASLDHFVDMCYVGAVVIALITFLDAQSQRTVGMYQYNAHQPPSGVYSADLERGATGED